MLIEKIIICNYIFLILYVQIKKKLNIKLK